MLGRQLNFLNIFDEESQKKDKTEKVEAETKNIQSPESQEKSEAKVQSESNLKAELVAKSESQPRFGSKPSKTFFIKLIPGVKLPNSELEILRVKLLESDANFAPDDFKPFAEEINKYHEHYEEIGNIFRQLASVREKIRLYEKKVYPNIILNEEKYLEASSLYMKYLRACNDNIKSNEAVIGGADEDLNKLNESQSTQPLSVQPLSEQPPSAQSLNEKPLNEPEREYEYPDPYGDIYPYSLNFRKKKKYR